MSKTPRISVIIPAYNAGMYIRKCLKSLKNQTFSDFMVIIIDDGSTDDTPDVIAEFTAEDERFIQHRTQNKGVSHARNIGIDMAKSEYITFVDADDELHPHALEDMYRIIHDTGASVVIGNNTSNLPFPKIPLELKIERYTYRQAMKAALYQKRSMNSPWGMLMKKELLDGGIRFREGIRYEDLDAFYRFYEKAELIVYVDFPYYFYRHSKSSFLGQWSPRRLDVLDVTDRMVDFFETFYPDIRDASEDRKFSAHFNMMALMQKNHVADAAALKRCWTVIKAGRKRALTDPNVRWKNKLGAFLTYIGGKPLIKFLSIFYN